MRIISLIRKSQPASAFFLILSGLFMGSCNHKTFGEPDGEKSIVRLVYDWSDAPEAAPAGMRAHFYNRTTGRHLYFDFPGSEGGVIEIEPGEWDLVSYNNDSEIVESMNEHLFDDHLISTRSGNLLETVTGNSAPVPRGKGTEDERVAATPDMMWGGTLRSVSVRKTSGSETVITVRPHELVCRYSYEIRNVSNLKKAVSMCASLSGMSGGLFVGGESLHEEPVTLPFAAAPSDESTIQGEFFTFGHHENNSDPHRLCLYVWMADGSKYVYGIDSDKFDVTDQVHSAPDRRRVHLIVDGLDLPQTIENGHGFNPSADNWLNENHQIEI